MYNLTKSNNVYSFNGSIDSTNSEEVSSLILQSFPTEGSVIFDFENVDYISSAGLRVILKAGKLNKSLRIINVCSKVFEVFEMTGFNEILNIKKALRVISIEGMEEIGHGACGKIYRMDPDTIIKVYIDKATTIEDIENEISMAKTAFVSGIPTAIPFDVVKVKEGGMGSVFELLKSECLNKFFIRYPDEWKKYTEMYASLIDNFNKTVPNTDKLKNKRNKLKIWYERLAEHQFFDETVLTKIKKLFDTIPEANTLVHGDLHIKNVMMQGDEPIIIDMDTLGIGHPIFEHMGVFLTYVGYPSTDPDDGMAFLGICNDDCERLFNDVIRYLLRDKPESEIDTILGKIELFSYIVLAAKTVVDEQPDQKRLEHCKEMTLKLIDKYDTLEY